MDNNGTYQKFYKLIREIINEPKVKRLKLIMSKFKKNEIKPEAFRKSFLEIFGENEQREKVYEEFSNLCNETQKLDLKRALVDSMEFPELGKSVGIPPEENDINSTIQLSYSEILTSPKLRKQKQEIKKDYSKDGEVKDNKDPPLYKEDFPSLTKNVSLEIPRWPIKQKEPPPPNQFYTPQIVQTLSLKKKKRKQVYTISITLLFNYFSNKVKHKGSFVMSLSLIQIFFSLNLLNHLINFFFL